MNTIEDHMAAEAGAFARTAGGADGSLDLSEGSLEAVDALLERMRHLEDPHSDPRLFGAAAYVMEVARREFGGRYVSGGESDPILLLIGEPVCRIGFLAMSKVSGRIDNGPEDSIPFFYAGIRDLVDRGVDATLC